MEAKAIRKSVVASENPTSITHAARTAAGAVASLLIARLFRLPEPYWAPITSIVVMQSTLVAAISISKKGTRNKLRPFGAARVPEFPQ
jgi:uncharacterized membrane protein YccC